MTPQFIPSVEIEFCGPDGEKHTRKLRFDLAARRVLRSLYIDAELEKSDPAEANQRVQAAIDGDRLLFFVRALYAMTYHEREDGEKPEDFEPFIGMQNLEYVGRKVGEAMGMGSDDEPDPTQAVNGVAKDSKTGKRSKRSQTSDSESRPNVSMQ